MSLINGFLLRSLFQGAKAVATHKPPVKFSGRVVRVVDGDTVDLRGDSGHVHRIRILDIDSPEKDQEWGDHAARIQNDILAGQTVTAHSPNGWEYDKYGRLLAYLDFQGMDVGESMVKAGLAWASETAPGSYQQAMVAAQRARIGVWASGRAIRPADHRAGANEVPLA